MNTKDFDYNLPEALIAQHPATKRDESRLLILEGKTGGLTDSTFKDVIHLFNPGDCLILNNTKVLPARLLGHKKDQSTPVEFLLLSRQNETDWVVICKPGRRLKAGAEVVFSPELSATVLAVHPDGNRLVRFHFSGIFETVLDAVGQLPLPPYIHETLKDKTRYQTVYAKWSGSAAAPTAGLHFTPDLLSALEKKGVNLVYVTLHVGLGTFRPVKTDRIEDHHMHAESY